MDFTKLLDYGVIGIILLAVGAGIVRLASFLKQVLFDKQDGIVFNFMGKHFGLMENLEKNLEIQTQNLKQQTDILGKVNERLSDIEYNGKGQIDILTKIYASSNGKPKSE